MEVIRILFLQKFWEVLHSIRILCLRVMFVGIWFFHKDEFDLLRIWREIRWNCFCHEKWTIVRCECFSLLRWSLIHFSLILAANKNPKQINISVRRVKWNLFWKNTLGFHLQPKMGNGYSNKRALAATISPLSGSTYVRLRCFVIYKIIFRRFFSKRSE